MELIPLQAEEGKWLTKEPSNVWQRYFWKRVNVPINERDKYKQVTDKEKADYERRRAEYMNQFNEEE